MNKYNNIIKLFKNQKRLFLTVISEYERGLRFSLGKFTKELQPGLHFKFPFYHSVAKIPKSTLMRDIGEIKLISSDNVTFTIKANVEFKVVDSYKAYVNVEQYENSVTEKTQMELKTVLGKMTIDEILQTKSEISQNIIDNTFKTMDEWGIKISAVSIKDIQFDESVTKSMAFLAETKRIAEAKLVNARSDMEASKIYSNNKNSMRLRELGLLSELSRGQNNTIVLVPLDMIKRFAKSKPR